MQLIPMAVGMGQQAAQNPNASIGGQGGFGLDKVDPIGKWIVGKGGDPYNLYGEKDNPGALFFPSSMPGSGGVPGALPNLGAQSLIPRAPGGAFMPPNLNGGRYNDMAALSAGPLFNPSAGPGGSGGKGGSQGSVGQVPPMPLAPGGKGGMTGSGGMMPINPELIQRLRLQQRGLK